MDNYNVHNIGWLIKTENGITISDHMTDDIIKSPDDLENGRYELHWHRDFSNAKSFANGIKVAGRNSINSTIGLGDVSQAVLVHFSDEDSKEYDNLNDAINLIIHSDTYSIRQSYIIWKDEIKNILSINPGQREHTSTPPIKFLEKKPDYLKLELKYDNWMFHPEYWQKLHGRGSYIVEIFKNNNSLIANFTFDSRSFENADTLLEKYKDELETYLKLHNASLKKDCISFSISENIVKDFEDMLPALEKINEILENNFKEKTLINIKNNPDNIKIANMINNGGNLKKDKGQWIVITKDEKTKKVTDKTVREIIRANMIQYAGNF